MIASKHSIIAYWGVSEQDQRVPQGEISILHFAFNFNGILRACNSPVNFRHQGQKLLLLRARVFDLSQSYYKFKQKLKGIHSIAWWGGENEWRAVYRFWINNKTLMRRCSGQRKHCYDCEQRKHELWFVKCLKLFIWVVEQNKTKN